MMQRYEMTRLVSAIGGALLLLGCGAEAGQGESDRGATPTRAVPRPSLAESFIDAGPSLGHVHGMSDAADGSLLLVGTHTGLIMLHPAGRWQRDEEVYHDLMGFVGVSDGYLSSGHPSPGSGLPNPLGIVRGDLDVPGVRGLAFIGESDFHLMAAAYYDHTLYVANPGRNSVISAGLWYTSDGTKSWNRSELRGLDGSLLAMAVHPTEPRTITIATTTGLYRSDDSGDSFTPIEQARFDASSPPAALAFAPSGAELVVAGTAIQRLPSRDGQAEMMPAPALEEGDRIVAIAVSPTDELHLAAATQAGDLYVTTDAGRAWTRRASRGVLNTQ